MAPFSLFLLISSQLNLISLVSSSTFTITNNCNDPIYPSILSGAGTAPLPTTGFALGSGVSKSVDVPNGWSGRLWARTHCSPGPTTGSSSCATGDTPPATLAEFTLGGDDSLDFYDVSLVDGYNLPLLITPQSGSGPHCSAAGCLVDLNGLCPSDLTVKSSSSDSTSGSGSDSGTGSVACKSACEAYGTEQYCCSGAYGNPNTCRPTAYSQLFKRACPRAYSYAYDDGTSTFTCTGAEGYAITFCPDVPSLKAGKSDPRAAGQPLINETMVFLSGDDISSASRAVPMISIAALSLLSMLSQVLRYRFGENIQRTRSIA